MLYVYMINCKLVTVGTAELRSGCFAVADVCCTCFRADVDEHDSYKNSSTDRFYEHQLKVKSQSYSFAYKRVELVSNVR